MESSVVAVFKDWMGMIEDQGTYSFLKILIGSDFGSTVVSCSMTIFVDGQHFDEVVKSAEMVNVLLCFIQYSGLTIPMA